MKLRFYLLICILALPRLALAEQDQAEREIQYLLQYVQQVAATSTAMAAHTSLQMLQITCV